MVGDEYVYNANAAVSPYMFSFCNDVAVPSGGQKAKDIAQSIFGQKVFKMEEFKNGATTVLLAGTVFASMRLRMLGSAGATRMRKTFEAGGNRKDEYPMCTTM